MRFSLPAAAFRAAFDTAAAGCGKGPLSPILHHVLCDAQGDGTVKLYGTDNTRGVTATLAGVRVEEPGRAVLHGPVVGAFLAAGGKADDLTVRSTPNVVILRAGGGECKPPILAVDQFPAAGEAGGEVAAEITADDLLTAVRRSAFAATDEAATDRHGQEVSRGVLIQAGSDAIRIAGMNSMLAAVTKAPATVHAGGSVMVPKHALGLIVKTLPGGGEVVRVRFLPGEPSGGVVFETPTVNLWVRAVQSKLPPVGQLVPPPDAKPVWRCDDALPLFTANRQALVSISDESQRGKFAFGADGCEVKTGSPTRGESAVRFALPGFVGEAVKCDFLAPAVEKIGGGLRKEDSVRAELHRMGHLRLVVRYGTPESGGLAVLMQMGEREEG